MRRDSAKRHLLIAIAATTLALLGFCNARAQSGDPFASKADKAFRDAVSHSDSKALAALLDVNFSWTDVNGKTQSATEISRALPKRLIADESKARMEDASYGAIADVQAHSGRMHVLRVWVKRPGGWKLLAYHEVQLRDTPPPAGAPPAAGAECVNPCKSIPFDPKTANQKAVAAAFSALETSVTAHDAKRWGSMIGDEFTALSSNSDKLLDKKTRMAELAQASMAGLVPLPVVWAKMTELGNAIVMESMHQPLTGKPLHATRIWVKRGDNWVETVSYQTTILAAPAK